MRYATDPLARPEQDYDIQDGLVLDPYDAARPTARRTRSWPSTKAERDLEEARWASLCGPVTIRHKETPA